MARIKFDLKAHEARMIAKIQAKTIPEEANLAGISPEVREKIKELARRFKGE